MLYRKYLLRQTRRVIFYGRLFAKICGLMLGRFFGLLLGRTRVVLQPKLDTVRPLDIAGSDLLSDDYLTELERIPAPILQAFIFHNWTFTVDHTLSDPVEKDYATARVGGRINLNEHTIKVVAPRFIPHEFGHFLDHILRNRYDFNTFHDTLYRAEAAKAARVLGSYSTCNAHEYFAEYFSYWLSHSDYDISMIFLQALSPETYLYFASLETSHWGLNTGRIRLLPRSV